MEEFVKKFSQKPDYYRELLDEAQLEKVTKSVSNSLEIAPKTDKITLEAKIIFRRFSNVLDKKPAYKWPTKVYINKMLFWKWMWVNNRDIFIKKYPDIINNVEKRLKANCPKPMRKEAKQKEEANIIWNAHIKSNPDAPIRKEIYELFDQQYLQIESEEEESNSEEPVRTTKSALKKTSNRPTVSIPKDSSDDESSEETVRTTKSAPKKTSNRPTVSIPEDSSDDESSEETVRMPTTKSAPKLNNSSPVGGYPAASSADESSEETLSTPTIKIAPKKTSNPRSTVSIPQDSSEEAYPESDSE